MAIKFLEIDAGYLSFVTEHRKGPMVIQHITNTWNCGELGPFVIISFFIYAIIEPKKPLYSQYV